MEAMMLRKITKYLILVLAVITIFQMESNHAQIATPPQRAAAPLPKYNESHTNGKNIYSGTIRLYAPMEGMRCTGFVIDGNYAMTAAHCVKGLFGAMEIIDFSIKDIFDNETGIIATPVAMDPYRDIAFIKGNFENFKSYPVDFTGEHIFPEMKMNACGFPANQKMIYCTNLTLIANHNFVYRTIGSPIFKGMSGGPVFSVLDNFVVGINSAVDENSVMIGPLVGALEEVGLR